MKAVTQLKQKLDEERRVIKVLREKIARLEREAIDERELARLRERVGGVDVIRERMLDEERRVTKVLREQMRPALTVLREIVKDFRCTKDTDDEPVWLADAEGVYNSLFLHFNPMEAKANAEAE